MFVRIPFMPQSFPFYITDRSWFLIETVSITQWEVEYKHC